MLREQLNLGISQKTLQTLATDFAAGIELADADRPIARNARSHQVYKPGIGPHPENATVSLVLTALTATRRTTWSGEQGVPYPGMSRQSCDLVIELVNETIFVEIKMLRMMGDNGKPNDNMIGHILSPYARHRSALTDVAKLKESGFPGEKAILIFGYDYPDYPMELALDAFEKLADRGVSTPRAEAEFRDLVHPIHQAGRVAVWGVV